MQTGNDGRFGGTSSDLGGDPAPATQYVDSGFQVDPILLGLGILIAIAATAAITYTLTKNRNKRKA